MRNRLIIPLIPILMLTSCSKSNFVLESKIFCFDTVVDIRLYEGKQENLKDIEGFAKYYSKLADNYLNSGYVNVYTLNQNNDTYEVTSHLYNMIKEAKNICTNITSYFNPLCGSISKLWKASLAEGKIPNSNVISTELTNLKNSSIVLGNNNKITRKGKSEIDLGAFAKGYTLDVIKDYLIRNELKSYLIDAGSSSILLGEKQSSDGLFSVGLKDLRGKYLKLQNCFVSTSSISNQGVEIDGVMYSHIIDPLTGSAINKHDTVIVVSDNGGLGDALSTAFMLMDLDQIKELENSQNVKAIVIKNGAIEYKNEGIEVFNH